MLVARLAIKVEMSFIDVDGGVEDELRWASTPNELTKEAAGQKSEHTGSQTCAEIQAEHAFAMAFDIPLGEKPERAEQTKQGDRDQQMNPRKMQPEWKMGFDKDGRDGRDQHHRDPSVAKGAVQFGALLAS